MVCLSSGSRNLSKMSTRSSWKMQEHNLSACLMRKRRRKMSFWWIVGEIQIHFTTKCLERIYRYDSEHVHNKALNIVYVFIQLAAISTFLYFLNSFTLYSIKQDFFVYIYFSICHFHQILFNLQRSTLRTQNTLKIE